MSSIEEFVKKEFSVKDAELTLTLKADDGYESDTVVRISADQWFRINQIIAEE